MIFAKTCDAVMSGEKCQTVRAAKPGDRLGEYPATTPGVRISFLMPAVLAASSRVRWYVGQELAVQPNRGQRAVGRIVVTSLAYVADPTAPDVATDAWARAEGFGTVAEWLAVWRELHPRSSPDGYWVVGINLASGSV